MRAISIRQPWAWLIINAGKDIENRTWRTNVRGQVLVHAAKGCTRDKWLQAAEFAHYECGVQHIPSLGKLERGGIIGKVTIADCVSESESPWFVGPQGFLLRDPIALPFTPYRGELGFFNVERWTDKDRSAA